MKRNCSVLDDDFYSFAVFLKEQDHLRSVRKTELSDLLEMLLETWSNDKEILRTFFDWCSEDIENLSFFPCLIVYRPFLSSEDLALAQQILQLVQCKIEPTASFQALDTLRKVIEADSSFEQAQRRRPQLTRICNTDKVRFDLLSWLQRTRNDATRTFLAVYPVKEVHWTVFLQHGSSLLSLRDIVAVRDTCRSLRRFLDCLKPFAQQNSVCAVEEPLSLAAAAISWARPVNLWLKEGSLASLQDFTSLVLLLLPPPFGQQRIGGQLKIFRVDSWFKEGVERSSECQQSQVRSAKRIPYFANFESAFLAKVGTHPSGRERHWLSSDLRYHILKFCALASYKESTSGNFLIPFCKHDLRLQDIHPSLEVLALTLGDAEGTFLSLPFLTHLVIGNLATRSWWEWSCSPYEENETKICRFPSLQVAVYTFGSQIDRFFSLLTGTSSLIEICLPFALMRDENWKAFTTIVEDNRFTLRRIVTSSPRNDGFDKALEDLTIQGHSIVHEFTSATPFYPPEIP